MIDVMNGVIDKTQDARKVIAVLVESLEHGLEFEEELSKSFRTYIDEKEENVNMAA